MRIKLFFIHFKFDPNTVHNLLRKVESLHTVVHHAPVSKKFLNDECFKREQTKTESIFYSRNRGKNHAKVTPCDYIK